MQLHRPRRLWHRVAPDFIGAANASLFELSSRPWNGTTFSQQARVAFVSAEAHSAAALGIDCVISCTPAASTTRQDVLRVSASIGLSMFGTNPLIDENRHLQLCSYTIAALPAATVVGQVIYFSDLGGGGGQLLSDGTRWQRVTARHQTIATDANLTLKPLASAEEQRHTGTLTANRTITLSTTNAYPGGALPRDPHGQRRIRAQRRRAEEPDDEHLGRNRLQRVRLVCRRVGAL